MAKSNKHTKTKNQQWQQQQKKVEKESGRVALYNIYLACAGY